MTSGRLPRREPGKSVGRACRPVFLYLGAGLMVVLLGGFAGETRGQVEQHAGHPLGTVDFPITCSEQAQEEFNRAVALLHHMTYPQAREAFQRVATTDPRCAMAYWGIAMTLFQPLWPTRPGSEALQRGWEVVQKAKALQPPTERERLFVAAAEAALEYPAGDHGEFIWDEFPHAIEYLIYAYLQKGADDEAAAQLKRLRATARLEPTFKTAFHLASTQARNALERRAWSEAALLVSREPATLDWDRFAWPEAIMRFARGLGAARCDAGTHSPRPRALGRPSHGAEAAGGSTRGVQAFNGTVSEAFQRPAGRRSGGTRAR